MKASPTVPAITLSLCLVASIAHSQGTTVVDANRYKFYIDDSSDALTYKYSKNGGELIGIDDALGSGAPGALESITVVNSTLFDGQFLPAGVVSKFEFIEPNGAMKGQISDTFSFSGQASSRFYSLTFLSGSPDGTKNPPHLAGAKMIPETGNDQSVVSFFIDRPRDSKSVFRDTYEWFVKSDVEPVPEPASWVLLLGGFALIGAALRRQRAAVSV